MRQLQQHSMKERTNDTITHLSSPTPVFCTTKYHANSDLLRKWKTI